MSNTAKIKGLVGMQKQNRGWNNATVLITLKSSINKKSIIGNKRIKHNKLIHNYIDFTGRINNLHTCIRAKST